MDTLMGITNRSTYDQAVAHINAAVKDFLYDQEGQIDVSEDEVWCDMASALLVDASENVAREVCRVQLGFVPIDLLRLWQERAEAKKVADNARNRARTVEKKKAAAEAEIAARAAAVQAQRDRMCQRCFVVRSASGACNCV